MDLLLAQDVAKQVPIDVGSLVGRPVIFLIEEQHVLEDGVLEILRRGIAFTNPLLERCYVLLSAAITVLQTVYGNLMPEKFRPLR